MQIIASILAEMFGSGELIDQSKYADVAADTSAMRRLDGARLVEGVAIGRAWLHEPRVEVTRLLAENPQAELARLDRAIGELREALDQMLATSDLGRRRAARGAGSLPDVRARHRLAAADPRGDRHRAVGRGRGPPGPGGDPRPDRPCQRPLSARAADRPRRHRQPAAAPSRRQGAAATIRRGLPDDTILVARNLGAADLLEYDRRKLRGIVLEEGSKTAHVTIVARAIGIPMVGRIEGAMAAIDPGNPVVARRRQRPSLRPAERRDPAGVPQRDAGAGRAAALLRADPRRCRR